MAREQIIRFSGDTPLLVLSSAGSGKPPLSHIQLGSHAFSGASMSCIYYVCWYCLCISVMERSMLKQLENFGLNPLSGVELTS